MKASNNSVLNCYSNKFKAHVGEVDSYIIAIFYSKPYQNNLQNNLLSDF